MPPRAAVAKAASIDLILRGHPFSPEEQASILAYNREDVLDTMAVAKKMLPLIDSLPQAVFRAHFMRAVARIQRAGVPIDASLYSKLFENREQLKLDLVEQLAGTELNVYEGSSLRYQKLVVLIKALGLEVAWPKPPQKRFKKSAAARVRARKVFSTEVESLEAMANLRPELAPLVQVVKQVADLRSFDLVVGSDACARYPVFPFSTNTGRCAPPAKRFLFAQSSWTRGFIAPPPGWALAYLDYSAAEVLIAAVLSGDKNLLKDYLDGDVYVNYAIRMGLAPSGATKATIGSLRGTMKIWLLSTLYGTSPKSLHEKLRVSSLRAAEHFVRQNHDIQPHVIKRTL